VHIRNGFSLKTASKTEVVMCCFLYIQCFPSETIYQSLVSIYHLRRAGAIDLSLT